MIFIDEEKEINLKEYQLIIPSVSVGNVGQLAADLLISTLNLTKIGYIRHRNILPVAAYVSGTPGLTTECELYSSANLKIAVVQIRSTYGRFVTISQLLKSICESVKSVVILSGGFAYERKNIHLVTESIRFLSQEASKGSIPEIPENWQILEVSFRNDGNGNIRVPGSGIADHLYNLCVEEKIPVTVIVNFVSEGDNRGDAANLATYLDSWLKLRSSGGVPDHSWRFPAVWDSLYGNSFPRELL